MKNYTIYKAQNIITDEVYIGVTSIGIERRKKDHIRKSQKGNFHPFQNAIATYGVEAFIWEEIDTATSSNELANKEKEYILKYDSKTNGYNSDRGGGIKKTIYQYSIKDGGLIGSFESLEYAAKAVNVDKKTISKAALGVINTAGGYYWSYSSFPKQSKDQRIKRVVQLSHDILKIDEFESIAQASLKTGVNKTSIAKVCRGERKMAGGYRWSFLN